jgi:hypothetical protein
MSTVKQPLKYLWTAIFEDGHIIAQPEDDRYTKHDDTADHNPSAFRDILDYQDKSPLEHFLLVPPEDDTQLVSLDLTTGEFSLGGFPFKLNCETSVDRKLIYFRNIAQDYIDGVAQDPYVESYNVGFEYKNKDGRTVKRIITVDA